MKKIKKPKKRLKRDEICFVINPNCSREEIHHGIAELNDRFYGNFSGRVLH